MNKEQAQQVAAAELLGWTHRSGVMEYDGEKMPFTIWSKDGKEVGGDRMPNFHTDANASLMLIEFMRGKGFDTRIEINSKGDRPYWISMGYHQSTSNVFQLSVLHAFLRANGREDLL